jgi:hypothetical protein
VGGPNDSSLAGAVWVFIRDSAGLWSQQGTKLVGTGTAGNAQQGFSIALSADGNTAIVGGPGDSSGTGAAWVFTRRLHCVPTCVLVWSQQGNNLIGTGAVGNANQGWSVALSGGGNTAIVGGPFDSTRAGAAWVFIRDSAGLWSQQGTKLVGSDALGIAQQGYSVALSCNTAVVGGPVDNSQAGAAWVFVAPPTGTHDFNGDCLSDILWRDTSGNTAAWLMNGGAILQTGGFGAVPTTWSVVGQRDFNGDGKYDLLWRDTSGNTAIWLLNGLQISQTGGIGNIPTTWLVAGTADFNGDGKGDILWKDNLGNVAIWLMNGLSVLQAGGLGNVGGSWNVALTGDYNGDGKSDILWRDTSGNTAIWFMNGLSIGSTAGLGNIPTTWTVQGVNAD